MKVALYARYSSDNQRDASIHDQFQVCRAYADKQGWQIVEEYSDYAVSGASLLRPGIQALIADAARGRFQCVLAEAMDRLSRDQEDIAGLFKRMVFGNVKIVTLAEGEVSHLHIGLKGTMNALFVKDLADKTHRGLRGRVEQGKSGGGNAYGYAVVRSVDPEGEVGRGERKIKPDESAVVQRIFRKFVGGKSAKKIAGDLNRDGIRGPSGGAWGFSTILGNSKRGTGILNNELYTGRLVWNRQRYIKDPETGRRQARPNPPEEWITHDVPELRIVDATLWDAAKARQSQTQLSMDPDGSTARFRDRTRARYLLSGLTKCGVCGGGYSQISSTSVGCSTARNKGTCDNRMNIRRDVLEARVLSALRDRLMEPTLFKRFCEEFTRETNRLRMEGRAKIDAMNAEVTRINKDLDMLVELILRGGNGETLSAKMLRLEARRRLLKEELAIAVEPPPLLHPEMASHYRQELDTLYEALEEGDDIARLRTSATLRSLMESVVLTPANGELAIDLRGDLAGILHIAMNAKNPAASATGGSQFELVAGTGFEPVTFRL